MGACRTSDCFLIVLSASSKTSAADAAKVLGEIEGVKQGQEWSALVVVSHDGQTQPALFGKKDLDRLRVLHKVDNINIDRGSRADASAAFERIAKEHVFRLMLKAGGAKAVLVSVGCYNTA